MNEKEQFITHEDEGIIKNLTDRVRQAMINCISLEEQNALLAAEDQLMNRFIGGEISLKEYCQQNDVLRQNIPGEVAVDNFDDCYILLMTIFNDHDYVLELIDHERQHAKEAIDGGLEPELIMRFSRLDNGKVFFNLAVRLNIPEDGDGVKIRKTLMLVIKAPLELSDSDQQKLSGLNKNKV